MTSRSTNSKTDFNGAPWRSGVSTKGIVIDPLKIGRAQLYEAMRVVVPSHPSSSRLPPSTATLSTTAHGTTLTPSPPPRHPPVSVQGRQCRVRVRPNDFVLVGTGGLFANLCDSEIPNHVDFDSSPARVARQLIQVARTNNVVPSDIACVAGRVEAQVVFE